MGGRRTDSEAAFFLAEALVLGGVFFAAARATAPAFFRLGPADFRFAFPALFATFHPLLATMRHSKWLPRTLIAEVGETEAATLSQQGPLLVQTPLIGDRLAYDISQAILPEIEDQCCTPAKYKVPSSNRLIAFIDGFLPFGIKEATSPLRNFDDELRDILPVGTGPARRSDTMDFECREARVPKKKAFQVIWLHKVDAKSPFPSPVDRWIFVWFVKILPDLFTVLLRALNNFVTFHCFQPLLVFLALLSRLRLSERGNAFNKCTESSNVFHARLKSK
jgi:hypothetical protein